MSTVALAELKPALDLIARRVDEAIYGIRAFGSTPAWTGAVDAVLDISRAPKHLVRAQLVLIGGISGGGDIEDVRLQRFAVGVELLHLFLLIHDDVMDNATQRRGKPALRVALQRLDPSIAWQVARDLAILMGNMLHVLAMRHLMPGAGRGESTACTLMLDALSHAGAGQFQDLLGWRKIGDDEAVLRRALVDKTAYQAFAAPFAAGIALVNPDLDLQPAIAWGCRLGLAFQVLDDVADLIAPASVTGKDALRDMLEGRPSLPLLMLHERAQGEERRLLESLVGHGILAQSERAELYALVEKHQVVDACLDYVRREIEGSRALLSPSWTERGRAGMEAVALGLTDHLENLRAEAARGA
ncbi:MAG: polyprenyl synthetase family protein [Myxococcota bacterium]